jgi:hypothetical protein
VLSRTVDWLRRSPAQGPGRRDDPPIWLVLSIAAALAAAGVSYVYFRTKSEKRSGEDTTVVEVHDV